MEETKIIEEKKKLKILFIGSNPNKIGGIETFGRNLKKKFKDDIFYFTYEREKGRSYSIKGVHEYKKRKYYPKILRSNIQRYVEKKYLEQTIKKIKPDILILNSPQDLKKIKNLKMKKILVQHRNPKQYWETDSYFNRDKKLLLKVKKEVDIIITLSPYDKTKFIEKFDLSEEKIRVIRHMSEIPLLNEVKLKQKKLIVLSRLVESKRLDLAIKVMKRLVDYQLLIYGNGVLEKQLKELLKKEDIRNVKFCGITSDILEKLDENSIFIMTSEHEGYPLTVIEAMKRRLPIIIRNTFTSTKDIINNNGILLDKEWDEEEFINSVKKVYNNYEFYSKNSLEQGKRHSFEIIKEKWIKVVEEVLK